MPNTTINQGYLFKVSMGDEWNKLNPNLQRRFCDNPPLGVFTNYQGIMKEIKASKLGKVLGFLMQRTGAFMPYTGKDINCNIQVSSCAKTGNVLKKRTYYFKNKEFNFNSRIILTDKKELIEFVGGRLGMKVKTFSNEQQTICFKNDGYFLNLGFILMPLPKMISPGNIYVSHKNISTDSFEIQIMISHPWFGMLFEQNGIFKQQL